MEYHLIDKYLLVIEDKFNSLELQASQNDAVKPVYGLWSLLEL